MLINNKLRKLNVPLKDLSVIEKINLRLKFNNIHTVNYFINNKTLLELLDISVRIPQSLIYRHGLVYGVELGLLDED